ncbi:hypothetical protein H0264_21410 [Nocardia huaxiensis]|uniref:Head-to-tail stopper n=1 Tax=Nocardia huaxiensis TaxID=2755382 RepID=A0A7D6VE00_9NOCA|nr:hypothetical protein [Nocardia huaxiensis]QLY27976.1 hypothetical protein H0264_21410 [Nocardia huaxiensis]
MARGQNTVTTKVIGWNAPQSLVPKTAGVEAVVVEVEMYVPPGFPPVRHGDEIKTLADGFTYQVIGLPEDMGYGPFGFKPGAVINLKRWWA